MPRSLFLVLMWFASSIGVYRFRLMMTGAVWSWMGRLISGNICKFSVDLVFEQLLCILLDLDWLERSPWSIWTPTSQSQWSQGWWLCNWLVWTFYLYWWPKSNRYCFLNLFFLEKINPVPWFESFSHRVWLFGSCSRVIAALAKLIMSGNSFQPWWWLVFRKIQRDMTSQELFP